MAEAFAELLKQRYPTAKAMARGLKIELSTAENVFKGHLSLPTIASAFVAEGRVFAQAWLDEAFGETFAEYEERRLQTIITEAENARQNLVRLRTRREELLSGAPELASALAGPAPPTDERGQRGRGASPDRQGHGTAPRARDRGSR